MDLKAQAEVMKWQAAFARGAAGLLSRAFVLAPIAEHKIRIANIQADLIQLAGYWELVAESYDKQANDDLAVV